MDDQTVICFHLSQPLVREEGLRLKLIGKIQEQAGEQGLVPGLYSSFHIKEADQKDSSQDNPAGKGIEKSQSFLEFSEHVSFPPLLPFCSPHHGL